MHQEGLLSTKPKRILLPRFDTLGDIVLLEGLLEALLERFPQAKLSVLVRRVFADLNSLFPDAIEWLTTDLDPHRQSPDVSLGSRLLDHLGSNTWDLVLVTAHNRTWVDDLVAAKMIGSRCFALGRWTEMPLVQGKVFEELGLSVDCPYEQMIPVTEESHEIQKYQTLWNILIGESTLPGPKLQVNDHQQQVAEEILQLAGLKAKSYCFCFPAGTQKVAIKIWPPDRFAEIITWLEVDQGLPSLLAGHRSETDQIEEIEKLAREKGARPRKWIGRDGEIPILAALAEASSFYLGNDTGPMHIAAAVDTPVVAIFGGGTWPRFIPRGNKSIAIAGEMPCFGCGWDCMFENAPCMKLVAVADVKQAILSLFRDPESKGMESPIRPASTKLDAELLWYVEKSVENRRKLESEIKRINTDRTVRLQTIERLNRELSEVEADRAARLELIERLNKEIAAIEADRAARLRLIEEIDMKLKETQQKLEKIKSNLLIKILTKIGFIRN